MQCTQFLAVEAGNPQKAIDRANYKVLELVGKNLWFDSIHTTEQPPVLIDENVMSDLMDKRFQLIPILLEDLDMNRVIAAINAYFDPKLSRTDRVYQDIMRRFEGQADIAIEAIQFVDERWSSRSLFFDLETMTGSPDAITKRMHRPNFFVPFLINY